MNNKTNHTALLVMDMQHGIIADLPGKEGFLKLVSQAILKARKNDIPIIFVRVGFREKAPEISANNKLFSKAKERFTTISPKIFMQVDEMLAPREEDILVSKRRISAFTGSDLEVILRAKEIKHLVLAGVSTSGVVLSTLREAADKDYELTVLEDCCFDKDQEVHRVLVEKVFPSQASITKTDDWIIG
ncbi:MAG TPA: cysteine hydrolase [Leeuwenhoekiella sp.]|nr:cysteine hydrolase [Leeuwenhoekiella sp.]